MEGLRVICAFSLLFISTNLVLANEMSNEMRASDQGSLIQMVITIQERLDSEHHLVQLLHEKIDDQAQQIQQQQENNDQHEQKIQQLLEKNDHHEQRIQQLLEKNDHQEQRIQQQQEWLSLQAQQMQHLQEELILTQRDEEEHRTMTDDMFEDLQTQMQQRDPSIKYAYSSFGCVLDSITLSCPSERLINVTNAEYGMKSETCSDECCAPYPMDCIELVSENDLSTWVSLKYTCDNTTNCSFLYEGAIINDCEFSYAADYMQITYDCLPENIEEPIGFTARASVTRTYSVGDVIIYDEVVTNYGNGYNVNSNIFTCPRHGIYVFGGVTYVINHSFNVGLMIDDVKLVEGYVRDRNGDHTSTTFQAIVTCNKGQLVWIMSESQGGDIFSDINAQTLFYGSFLQHI